MEKEEEEGEEEDREMFDMLIWAMLYHQHLVSMSSCRKKMNLVQTDYRWWRKRRGWGRNAGAIGVVDGSLASHIGTWDQVLGRQTGSSDLCLKWRSTPAIIVGERKKLKRGEKEMPDLFLKVIWTHVYGHISGYIYWVGWSMKRLKDIPTKGAIQNVELRNPWLFLHQNSMFIYSCGTCGKYKKDVITPPQSSMLT